MRKENFESFRLTRFKMRKIGNRWIRIGLTRLGFLNIESADISDEAVDENHHIVKNALKGALSFGALSGGIFLDNNLTYAQEVDQEFLAEETSVAISQPSLTETTSQSQELTTVESTENLESTSASISQELSEQALSNSISESESTLISESMSESESLSLSESISESQSEQLSLSLSTETSESISSSESISQSLKDSMSETSQDLNTIETVSPQSTLNTEVSSEVLPTTSENDLNSTVIDSNIAPVKVIEDLPVLDTDPATGNLVINYNDGTSETVPDSGIVLVNPNDLRDAQLKSLGINPNEISGTMLFAMAATEPMAATGSTLESSTIPQLSGVVYKASGIRYMGLEEPARGSGTSNTITMTLTSWFDSFAATGPNTDYSTLAGKYVVEFANSELYDNIASLSFSNNGTGTPKYFQIFEGGKYWSLDLASMQLGPLGSVQNDTITITLKNGATLDSLGLTGNYGLQSFLVNTNNQLMMTSYDNSYISSTTAVTDAASFASKFTNGRMTNKVNLVPQDQAGISNSYKGTAVPTVLDGTSIKSTHIFKPDENFLESDNNWVLNIHELIPTELIPYINLDRVYLYNSDYAGNIGPVNTASYPTNPIKLVVGPDGVVDTANTPAISILNNQTTTQLKSARNTLNDNVFWGTLGQTRAYTIQYTLKDEYNDAAGLMAISDLLANKADMTFESWITADYLDSKNNVNDGKALAGSYANAFLYQSDLDNDGIPDKLESAYGTDVNNPDTDGDGVGDGVEVLGLPEAGVSKTNPLDGKDYIPGTPTTSTNMIDTTKATTVPITIDKFESSITDSTTGISTPINVTNTNTAGIIVDLVSFDPLTGKYDMNKVYGTTTLPGLPQKAADGSTYYIVDGSSNISIAANKIPTTEKFVALVARSSNGLNPTLGTIIELGQQDSLSLNTSASISASTSDSLSASQSVQSDRLSQSLSDSVASQNSLSVSVSQSESAKFVSTLNSQASSLTAKDSTSISQDLSNFNATSASASMSESNRLSDSTKLSESARSSLSVSASQSKMSSLSVSQSTLDSLNTSFSQSQSLRSQSNASMIASASTSYSQSVSTSASLSGIANSTSRASVSTSLSTSASTASLSVSRSQSTSQSVLNSQNSLLSQSVSQSTSMSLAVVIAQSTAAAQALSNSLLLNSQESDSLSTSTSISISNLNSYSIRYSESLSDSISVSASESLSTSISKSNSIVASESLSTSVSDSESLSTSISDSES
ncbi:hypothetical protein SAMN04488558_106122, partial [Ignavigranum ruoffiae]